MRVKVNGKQIDIGDSLRAHVEQRLTAGVLKYAERPVEAAVTFSRDAHFYKCDCSAYLKTGLDAQSEGRHEDIYASFDQALERLEKQLRRHKRRLKDHHSRRLGPNGKPIERVEAASYILAATADHDEHDAAEETPADHPGADDALRPVIIAEAKSSIPALTVGEAVMQMEMAHQPLLMFRNEAHGELNVVYRRPDGHIGWIDPNGARARA